MPTPNEVGHAARDRAIRTIARELQVEVNPSASYEDTRTAVEATLDFNGSMWLDETLDTAELTAVAELDPNAWTEENLPMLSEAEIDAQTDEVVASALEDDEAPAPGMGM